MSTQIWRFNMPHRIGSICGFPCDQCEGATQLSGIDGEVLPNTPFVILREATVQEWIADCIKNGSKWAAEMKAPPKWGYYYEVTMD